MQRHDTLTNRQVLGAGPEPAAIRRACVVCREAFTISQGEQQFLMARELHLPKRCKPCRAKIKAAAAAGLAVEPIQVEPGR